MKKLLWILVLGLLISNPALCEIFELKKCYLTNASYKTYESWEEFNSTTHQLPKGKYKNGAFDDIIISINVEASEITMLKILSDEHNKEFTKKQQDLHSKEWNKYYKQGLRTYEIRQLIGDRPKSFKYIKRIFKITNYAGNILEGQFYMGNHFSNGTGEMTAKDPFNSIINIDLNKSIVEKISAGNELYQCTSEDQSIAEGKGPSSGTAFFVTSKGHLLTNNHVVEGCKLSKIIYFDKEHDTQLISTDKTLDLALLKTKVRPKSYISFSKDEPKKRQQIIVAGYPLGKGLSDDLKINDGRISSLKGFENNSNEITVDVAINPGNSGGPIISKKGQLVAIAVSGLSKEVTEGINFGIKASAAKNFLKSNKINPSAGYLNFSMDDDKIVELLEESTVYTYCN